MDQNIFYLDKSVQDQEKLCGEIESIVKHFGSSITDNAGDADYIIKVPPEEEFIPTIPQDFKDRAEKMQKQLASTKS